MALNIYLFLGTTAGLIAAFSYATQSYLVSLIVTKSSTVLICFIRNFISAILTLLVLIISSSSIFPDAETQEYIYLIMSGIAGVTLADALYLKTLSYIGARKTILLETLAPIFTAIICFFMNGLAVNVISWLGMGITIYGVYIVVNAEQKQKGDNQNELVQSNADNPIDNQEKINIIDNNQVETLISNDYSFFSQNKNMNLGIMIGILANFCQALGMILAHMSMQKNSFNPLNSTFIRLASGIIFIAIALKFDKGKFNWPIQSSDDNKKFLASIIIGAVLGIWSQQYALTVQSPEVVQTLLATTPIFGLFISKWRGEKMLLEYYVGTLVAVIGVVFTIQQ